MMGRAEREKGKRGERELAKELRICGFEECMRGQQYCGANGDADVIGLPGVHIECKRVERLNIDSAMKQSEEDAEAKKEIPTVFHRKNRGEWRVTMNLSDWIKFYKAYVKLVMDE